MCRWLRTADEELPVVQGVGAFVALEQEDLCSAVTPSASGPGLLRSGTWVSPSLTKAPYKCPLCLLVSVSVPLHVCGSVSSTLLLFFPNVAWWFLSNIVRIRLSSNKSLYLSSFLSFCLDEFVVGTLNSLPRTCSLLILKQALLHWLAGF